jgi:copper chaperone
MPVNAAARPTGRRPLPSPRRRRTPDRGTVPTRPGTSFEAQDLAGLVHRLEASDSFCRDTRAGRLYHRKGLSFREISRNDSLHITFRGENEVSAHVDRHSPLALGRCDDRCRYSLVRVAAHNVSGMLRDLQRVALRRRGPDADDVPSERVPLDDEAVVRAAGPGATTPSPPGWITKAGAYAGTMTTYSVPGISCDHCKRAIEGEVGQVEGVDRVEVDVAAKTVEVAGTAPDDAVRAAIDEAGYEVAGAS